MAENVASSVSLREGAVLALKRRIFAPGTWRTHRSRVRTARRVLAKAGVPDPFPVTKEIMEVLYGVLKEKWTFVSSLYFASAACSTGGLQGPTPDEAGVWFTAAFTIIGVPLYGYTLGQFANGLSESYVKRKKKETMTAAISAAEFNVASHLRKGTNDGNIDLFSFTLLQLYRLRKTDEQEIQEIWNDFEDLDADKNG